MVKITIILIYLECINFVFPGHTEHKLLDEKVWKIVGIGPCPGTNLPFQLHFQGAKISPTLAFLPNITVIAKANLTQPVRLEVTIRRCSSRENLDTCEEFYKMKNMDICRAINPDNMLSKANPLVLPFKPKFKCPVKKDVYQALNVTVDMTAFVFFDVADWYWKTTGELFLRKSNTLLSCSYVEGYLVVNSKN